MSTTTGLVSFVNKQSRNENILAKEKPFMKRSNTFSNGNAKSQISLIRKPLANATSKANVTSTNALAITKVNAIVHNGNGDKKAINQKNASENENVPFRSRSATSPNFIKSRIPVEVKKVTNKGEETKKESSQDKLSAAFTFYRNNDLAYSTHLIPENVEDIDAEDHGNALLLPEYVNDIYSYLLKLEDEQSIRRNFLSHQPEMTPKMRAVLINWLVNVHAQFRLLQETLYFGVAIIDRFLQNEVVSKDKIQLVGVTAFYIASKFEEIYPPDIRDFVAICDNLYHKKDIVKMEATILKSLNFQLGRPLPLHFLRRYSKAAHANSLIHTMVKYLMELALVDYDCAHLNPSIMAAAAMYITLRCRVVDWTPTLCHYSGYTTKELLPYAAMLSTALKNSFHSKFQNVRKKYSADKFFRVANCAEFKSQIIDEIAAS